MDTHCWRKRKRKKGVALKSLPVALRKLCRACVAVGHEHEIMKEKILKLNEKKKACGDQWKDDNGRNSKLRWIYRCTSTRSHRILSPVSLLQNFPHLWGWERRARPQHIKLLDVRMGLTYFINCTNSVVVAWSHLQHYFFFFFLFISEFDYRLGITWDRERVSFFSEQTKWSDIPTIIKTGFPFRRFISKVELDKLKKKLHNNRGPVCKFIQ